MKDQQIWKVHRKQPWGKKERHYCGRPWNLLFHSNYLDIRVDICIFLLKAPTLHSPSPADLLGFDMTIGSAADV
jgi:hypothetical protein